MGNRTVVMLPLVLSLAVAVGGVLIVAESRHAPQTTITHTLPSAGGEGTAAAQAEVTIAAGARDVRVPDSFLGLSTEYWGVPGWERQGAVLDRVLSLLRVPGDGPLMLRIGGDSANEALWESKADEFPAWVVELTPNWLSQTSALVRREGVRLILDLNLITAAPVISAAWAGAAEAALPHGSIAGFEIGNEPDLYSRDDWIKIVSQTIAASQLLPDSLSPSVYAQDFATYAHAVAHCGDRRSADGTGCRHAVSRHALDLHPAREPPSGLEGGDGSPVSILRLRASEFPALSDDSATARRACHRRHGQGARTRGPARRARGAAVPADRTEFSHVRGTAGSE